MTIRVFVADDHPDARWAIIDSLARTSGLEILPSSARDRAVAYKLPRQIEPTLDLIYQWKPDVVVMDIWWPPDRNAGIRASRQIRDTLPDAHVLLYSGFVEVDLVIQAVLEGAVDGYVSKADYPSNTLPNAIRTVHRGLPFFVPEVVDRLLWIVRKDMAPPVVDLLLANLKESKQKAGASTDQVLSETEVIVLKRMARGESNAAIARSLIMSPLSVKSHVHHIYDKLGVREALASPEDVEKRVMAVLLGVRRGYVAAEDLLATQSEAGRS